MFMKEQARSSKVITYFREYDDGEKNEEEHR